MTDFGPIPVSGTVEVQAIANGPGGLVFSESFFLLEGADCTAECGFTTQPVSVEGNINDPIDFGLVAVGDVVWQESELRSGPFTDIAGPPTTISAVTDGMYYRACCAANPLVCSTVVRVTVG